LSLRIIIFAFSACIACAQTATPGTEAGSDAGEDASADSGRDVGADRAVPPIPLESPSATLAVGVDYACRIRSARQVQCWGGTLGFVPGGDPASRSGRAEISFDEDVLAVTAGTGTSCALLANGTIRCWGSNYGGLLGNGSSDVMAYVVSPTEVVDITDAVEIAGRTTLMCARLAHGSVSCWGDSAGTTGNGNGAPWPVVRPVPIEGTGDAAQICVGKNHGCFVGRNNRVSCWGDDRQGQTGQSDLLWTTAAREVPGLSGIVAVACGLDQSCALDAQHQVWCWGANTALELGFEGSAYRTQPATISGLPAVLRLPSMGPTPCAVTDAGAVWCWGRNQYGQLGPSAELGTYRAAPAAVTGISDVVDISSGLKFTCARRRDESVLCWGSGEFHSPEQSNRPIPAPTVVFPGS